jgi:hypothetical protein
VPVQGHVGKLGTLVAHALLKRVEGGDSGIRLLPDKGLEAGELTRDILISSHTLLTLALLVMHDARVVLGETVVE